jgi:hypothetical protein
MVALVQVLYASYTLYKSRGDQLNRFGYAAFGLTVIPYIIMSIINLVGNVLTPGYPTLYLVHSPELSEAKSRGAQIDSIVGKIQEDDSWYASKGHFTGKLSYRDNKGELMATLRLEAANQQGPQDTISVDIGHHFPHKDSLMNAPNGGILFREYSRFETIGKPYKGPKYSGLLWWGFMALFLGAIPYAVIGGLTRFHAAQSTQAQRVLTMFWLAAGILIGAAIPFYGFSLLEMIDMMRMFRESERERERERRERERKESEERKVREEGKLPQKIEGAQKWRLLKKSVGARKEREREERRRETKERERKRERERQRVAFMFMFLISLVFCGGAIGGFIVVGQMLKDYGSCILLS